MFHKERSIRSLVELYVHYMYCSSHQHASSSDPPPRQTSPAVDGSIPPNAMVISKAERAYAFVELHTAEEASNMMALDGVVFQGIPLKIRRPNNYDPNMAIVLGPLDPNPTMDTAQLKIIRTLVQVRWCLEGCYLEGEIRGAGLGGRWVGERRVPLSLMVHLLRPTVSCILSCVSQSYLYSIPCDFCSFVNPCPLSLPHPPRQDSPNKIFMGGLPSEWAEERVQDLLLHFGKLQAFNLVKDRNTGNSKVSTWGGGRALACMEAASGGPAALSSLLHPCRTLNISTSYHIKLQGYAFCEFEDPHVTDIVIQALHGKPVGNKFLTGAAPGGCSGLWGHRGVLSGWVWCLTETACTQTLQITFIHRQTGPIIASRIVSHAPDTNLGTVKRAIGPQPPPLIA